MKRMAIYAVLCSVSYVQAGCGNDDNADDVTKSDLPPRPSGPSLTAGVDYALDFDGYDDYATSGTAGFPIMRAPQTVSLWAQYLDTDKPQIMIVLRADLESGLAVGISEGTVAAWNIYGPRVLAAAETAPPAGVWHHIAYVFDGATHTLYIDGMPSGTGTREPGHRTPYLCWLGTFDGVSQLFQGRIDEVRIWNIARSAEEIRQEMEGDAAATDAALVAYWRFDTVEGSRVPDSSGHDNLVSLGEGDPQRTPRLIPSDVPVRSE